MTKQSPTKVDQAATVASDGRTLEVRRAAMGMSSVTPLAQRPMPRDFSISLAATRAADRAIVSPGGERRQPMRGFEDTFTDIVDFILRVTHHIWEEKSIGYLYESYRYNTTVVDDRGITYGRDRVIENTAQFIAAIPDIRLFADEIIWCGDENLGFYTSHRVLITGHNTGWSEWGPPTGRRVCFTCIANCRSVDNQINQEFAIYNTGSLLRQLGFDLPERAREVAAGRTPGLDDLRAGEIERLLGQGAPVHLPPPPDGGFDVEDFVRRTYHYVWNWRLLDRVDAVYAPGFRFHGPTDRELYGVGEYKGYLLSLLAMFPDLALQLDDVYWMGNEADGYLVAVRWTLAGSHRGNGIYGPPSGRRVRTWGITHLQIRARRIVEEWTVSNEFELLQQLVATE
jgi:predicted ester cyclase